MHYRPLSVLRRRAQFLQRRPQLGTHSLWQRSPRLRIDENVDHLAVRRRPRGLSVSSGCFEADGAADATVGGILQVLQAEARKVG